jgi:hypothetical protein
LIEATSIPLHCGDQITCQNWLIKIYLRARSKSLAHNKKWFMEKYHSRYPLTMEKLLEKFIHKYETIFNWLCVSFDKREISWKNLESYHERGVLN